MPKPTKKESPLAPMYKKIQKMDRRLGTYEHMVEDSLRECDRLSDENKMLVEELTFLKSTEKDIYFNLDEDPMVDAINKILDRYFSEESEAKLSEYEARLNENGKEILKKKYFLTFCKQKLKKILSKL